MECHPVGVVKWEVVGNNPGGSCPMGSRPGPCCIKLSYLTKSFPNGESSWWGRQSGWSKCCLMGSRPGRESSGWELFSGELS